MNITQLPTAWLRKKSRKLLSRLVVKLAEITRIIMKGMDSNILAKCSLKIRKAGSVESDSMGIVFLLFYFS